MPMAHAWAHTVGLRYCTNKQVTKLLARTCEAFEPRQAVLQLIEAAQRTRNLRLHEVALATLERHRARIENPEVLAERLESLRAHCGVNATQLLRSTLQGL